MTSRATFTQAQLTRAIKAADKATKAGIPTKVWVERDGRICSRAYARGRDRRRSCRKGDRSLMPRPRPPHLQREITRHGKAVWYVRVGRGPRVRIRAEFGTPEFDAEYRAALAGAPARKAAPSTSSLAMASRPAIVRRQLGPTFPPPRGGSATTSSRA